MWRSELIHHHDEPSISPGGTQNRDVQDYIKLLRTAARGKLALLGFAMLITWGLWTTLQAGDQKMPAITAEYQARLDEMQGSKPNEKPDGSGKAKKSAGALPATSLAIFNLKREYQEKRELAYVVRLRLPYLVDPIEINGLTLADWWPFVLISIVAAATVFSMRERVAAIGGLAMTNISLQQLGGEMTR